MTQGTPWGIYSQDENDPELRDGAVLLGVIVSVRKGRALQTAVGLFTNPPKRYIIAVPVDVTPAKGQDHEYV